MSEDFYQLKEPTEWSKAPSRFSFSSLQAIKTCPRNWQFVHSRWGEFSRYPERPHPKTLEGSIIHEALELLIRALGRVGMPDISTATFRAVVSKVGFWDYFEIETERWNTRLAKHPRSGPFFVLRTPPRDLANQAIRIFKEQYTPLNAQTFETVKDIKAKAAPIQPMDQLRSYGALSEIELSHPDLPFYGKIDLVQLADDVVKIVDFKTGKVKDEHYFQLQLYALLWWRATGVRPQQIALQYLNERAEFSVGANELERVEEILISEIEESRELLTQTPVEARPGDHCRFCPIRARCETGWTAYQQLISGVQKNATDFEVIVASEPSGTGFVGTTTTGEVDVVYDATVGQNIVDFTVTDRLRLIDVATPEDGVFEIRTWTEVYRVH